MPHRHRSSAVPPPCLRRTTIPKLITTLYNTDIGLFALSWSRSLLGRSLHLHHHRASFHLHIKPFPWPYHNKQGSKKLNLHNPATIFWDLSNAKYGSGPEPISGFYIAVVVAAQIILLVGDSPKQAYSKTGAAAAQAVANTNMILRREHVYGTKLYSTKANIGGHERNISIECRLGAEDLRLCFSIDDKRVLEIKHLKWKFRGNESVVIDGTYVQVSWDVYNWLFDGSHNHQEDGYALFMFTIFNQRSDFGEDNYNNSVLFWPQFDHKQHLFGVEFEEKKMKRKKGGGGLLRRSGRSSSSSSLSSSWGSCTSSVMEWAFSEEDDEFTNLPFSLLVYAWNKS